MSDAVPLVVFSDDWGRHPSSCQHLIRQLLPRRPITWVNTIGLRQPRFDRSTAKRGFEKLRAWLWGTGRRGCCGEMRPRILSPVMLPSFRSRIARGLNRRLLGRAIHFATHPSTDPIIITTVPLLADLIGAVRASRWVYYCVDDYSVWPGHDGKLAAREAELVSRVDLTIAVSETLQAHIAQLGQSARLLTHGVNLDVWREPGSAATPATLRELDDLCPPFVVFWGVIDRRMDLAIVRAIGEIMTRGTILLAGPRDDPDLELLRLPRVRVLPPVPFQDLPMLAARAAALIAPYADLAVTRAMQPLKLKEYLATSKPVVVRRLPATEPWADCCDMVETPRAFAAAVQERLRTGLPEAQRWARHRLASESWAAKARQFENWIDGAAAISGNRGAA